MHYSFYELRATSRLDDEFDPHLHCNIISIGGGKKKSKFSEETEQSSSKEQSATTAESSERSSASTGSQKGSTDTSTTGTTNKSGSVSAEDVSSQVATTKENISSLDDETKAILGSLVADAGGDLSELISGLSSSALSAEEDLGALIDPIVANARTNLEEQVGVSKQALARAAGGSTQNTLVQQLGLRESARAEGELADLAARLGLQTQQVASQQQSAAVDATGGLVAQLSNVLKGADTTRTGTTEADTVRALTELTDETSTQNIQSSELTDLVSEQALTELSSSVSESTMQEIAELFSKTKGRGKSGGASFGLSI